MPGEDTTTCRDEILSALEDLLRDRGAKTFRLEELHRTMRRRGTRYARSTINRYVTSVMCMNSASQNHGTYHDVERLKRGLYCLL